MEALMGFTPLAGIVVICLVIGQLLKITPLNSKYIPVCVAIAGGLLGLAGHLAPDFVGIPGSTNGIDAICIGIVSGLSSSGLHDAFDNFDAGSK